MGMSRLPMWMQWPAYVGVRAAMAGPMIVGPEASLEAAQALGRRYARSRLNRTRYQRALNHLQIAFPEWDEDRRRACATACFEHMAMLSVELAYSERLITERALMRHVGVGDVARPLRALAAADRPMVLICGHNGNWEVLGYAMGMLGFRMTATYRPIELRPLDAWVRRTRSRRGLRLVSKFGALRVLPRLLARHEPIAFTADQNGGDRGIFVPFFGRLASSYKSIALLAVQSRATIVCGQARRLRAHEPRDRDGVDAPSGSAREPRSFRFRIEIEDMFGPEEYMDQLDPMFYLSARYRRAIERMIERTPTDYLWMHRSWRSRPRHERLNRPFPPALREKLASLPWVDDAQVERLVDRSERDRRRMAELGVTRLP